MKKLILVCLFASLFVASSVLAGGLSDFTKEFFAKGGEGDEIINAFKEEYAEKAFSYGDFKIFYIKNYCDDYKDVIKSIKAHPRPESDAALEEKTSSLRAVEMYHERKFIKPLWAHMIKQEKVKFDKASKFLHSDPFFRFKK